MMRCDICGATTTAGRLCDGCDEWVTYGATASTKLKPRSPYTITMHFDMTDPDGRAGFNYAKIGFVCHQSLIELDNEMRGCVKHDGPPRVAEDDEGAALFNESIGIATEYWRDRLRLIMDENGVPWEVE